MARRQAKAGSTSAVARIRAICLGLPEATNSRLAATPRQPFGCATMFVVVSEDKSSMTVKAPEGVQGILVHSGP